MRWDSVKRRSKLEKLAYELEMEFFPKDEWGDLKLLDDFSLFRKGHSKRIRNLMKKQDAWMKLKLSIFDYRYIISTGKSSTPYTQTVFFVQSKHLALPQLWMKPENIFHKLATMLGMQDIDFEEHPEFSAQYLLQSEDEDRTRHLIGGDVARFFTVERNWRLEGVGYFLIFYRKNKVLEPHQIKNFYEKGMQLHNLLKEDPII
ncbi:MAG: hypothetical protein GY705_16065 [Bacteroidetes bacterium]|nr:hypothetical protein [Bacteroidota bacterium]